MIQRIDEWLSKQIMKGLTVWSVKGLIKGLEIAVKLAHLQLSITKQCCIVCYN